MSGKLLKIIQKLNVAKLSLDSIANYAYALDCCQFTASTVLDEWHQNLASLCEMKLNEIAARSEGETDLSGFALKHSECRKCQEIRRKSEMELFTRACQWHIVNEMISRNESDPLTQILLLAECLEADNYAFNLKLPYKFGERPKPFVPSDYADDKGLIAKIKELTHRANFIAREELIDIADYIQTEIVDRGESANHLPLVHAILCTEMPCFNYPIIEKEFEKAIKLSANVKEKSNMELAPYFYTLWSLTRKSSYLGKFEKTLRHCYLTLEKGKTYPDLGINKEDPISLANALQFLDDYRINVWILNDKYDVDKVIAKYKTA